MQTEDPKFKFLVETVGYIARSIANHQNTQTTFQLEKTQYTLTEHDEVLFLPSFEFIEKLFVAATKPRVA
jgi:hypothetical protein